MIGIYSYWSQSGLGIMAHDIKNLLGEARIYAKRANHDGPDEDFVTYDDEKTIQQWVKSEGIEKLIVLQFLDTDLRKLKCEKCLIPMGEWIEPNFVGRLMDFDRIHCISNYTRNVLNELKTLKISNAYDHSEYNYYVPQIEDITQSCARDRINILFDVGMGGIWNRKNMDMCLEAFNDVRRDDMTLTFKTQRPTGHLYPLVEYMLQKPRITSIREDLTRDGLNDMRSQCSINLSAQAFGEPDLAHFETMAMGMPQILMKWMLFDEFDPKTYKEFRALGTQPLPNSFTPAVLPNIDSMKDALGSLSLEDIKRMSKYTKGWVTGKREECKRWVRALKR